MIEPPRGIFSEVCFMSVSVICEIYQQFGTKCCGLNSIVVTEAA